MGAERHAIAAALLAGGCASTSTGADLERVRELVRLTDLAIEADHGAPAEVRELLRRPIDAEAAVRIALLNNRELRASLHELGVARGRLVQAGLPANPELEIEALPERDTTLELRIEYDITSLLVAARRSDAAGAELEAERFSTAGEVVQLGYEVRSAFYDLQAAEQRLEAAARALDAFAAARDAAEALLEAGNIPELDAASRIAAFERARISVAELELAAAERKERLQRLLGLHGEATAWRPAGRLPPVPEALALPEDLEAKAIRASLDLAETKHRLDALAHRTGVARVEGWVPDIAVDVHSLYGHPEEETAGDDSLWRFGAGVSLTLPFFDRKQGDLRAYEAQFDALAERYEGLAVELRSATREARARLVSAHGRALQFQRVILPAQARVFEQTLLQYNAMQRGIFELLQARRDQLEVELAYADTLREYWSASAALDALLAGRRVNGAGGAMPSMRMGASESRGDH